MSETATAKSQADLDELENMEDAVSKIKPWGLVVGLAGFFIMLGMTPPEGLSADGWRVLAIGFLMATWWITEALPIPVTSMIPMVAIPMLGLGSFKEASAGYAAPAIYLTLGGFILGVALEHWNLHLRIALNTIRMVGTKPHSVIAGFMLAAAFLSMWITNTATTVMMLPIAVSVVMLLTQQSKNSSAANKKNFGTAMMIGLAFSASIGGMMTLVGTSTNVMFKGFMEETYGIEITFMDWMKIGVPVGVTLLFFCWFMLTKIVFPCQLDSGKGAGSIIHEKLRELGKMTRGEKRTLAVFAFTAFLWMFNKPLNDALPWLQLNTATIAVLGAILLFIVPANLKKQEFLLDWESAKKVPWGILLLLGGGISMAKFLSSTGVADWMGMQIAALSDLPMMLLIVITTLTIIVISSLMSNVATLTAFMPVLIAASMAFGENPLTLAIPAALAASCAFMLPIGTPPNAIVFGSGYIKIPQMVNAGLILTVFAVAAINIVCYFLLPEVFGVEYGVMPDWAQNVKQVESLDH
jgi:sodium-dependent dicarboxylate transporter 2/3/5